MLKFLQKLWHSPLKGSLMALPAVAIGIVVNRLTGPSGQVQLPAQSATDLLIIFVGIVSSIGGVAYSCWKKCQPSEKIAAAKALGRTICPCTEDGTVMLLDPKRSTGGSWDFVCPKCGHRTEELSPGMLSAMKKR